MELSALIQRARGLVDDRVTPLIARDTDFADYANRAIREAAERSLCLRSSYDLVLSVGDGSYEIPITDTRPESIVIQRVYVNGVPLAKGSAEQMEAWLELNTKQDTPTTFGQRDQTLFLAPLPNEILTITLSGVWYPLKALSMEAPDGQPEIPTRLHDDLAHWLAYEAIISADAGDSRSERRTRLAERHLNHFVRRFGPSRSAREINAWRELPQERRVRGPGTV